MKNKTCIIATVMLVLTTQAILAQKQEYHPTYGPAMVTVRSANIILALPERFFFLEGAEATKLMKELGNPDANIDALIAPTETNADWYLYFRFNDLGYFKMEDVKEGLDEIDLLAEIRKNTDAENQNRMKLGFPSIQVVGYTQQLTLNTARQTLDYAIEASEAGSPTVERRSIFFGRKGLLVASFVTPKNKYATVKLASDNIFLSLSFQNSYRYADFNASIDKYAAVGIGTVLVGREIVQGGWLSKTLKSLGKAIWAFIVGIFAAIWVSIKKLFGRKTKPALASQANQTNQSQSQNNT